MINRRKVLVGATASVLASSMLPFPTIVRARVSIEYWPVYESDDGFYPPFKYVLHSIVENGNVSYFTGWGLWENGGRTDIMFVYATQSKSMHERYVHPDTSTSFINRPDSFIKMNQGKPLLRAAFDLFKTERIHAPEREWADLVIYGMHDGLETGWTASANNALNHLVEALDETQKP